MAIIFVPPRSKPIQTSLFDESPIVVFFGISVPSWDSIRGCAQTRPAKDHTPQNTAATVAKRTARHRFHN